MVVADRRHGTRDLHPVSRDQLLGLAQTLGSNSMSSDIQLARAWIVPTIESRLVDLLGRGFDLPKRTEAGQMFAVHPGCHARCWGKGYGWGVLVVATDWSQVYLALASRGGSKGSR